MKRGKKYVEAAKAIDRATLYDVADAVSLVKKTATAKFDETIEALYCRTVLVRRYVSSYLQKTQRQRKQRQPELIM